MNLRRLILFLALLSALITLANTFYASYRVQRELLIETTLASNRAYADKVADSVDQFLQSTQQQLAYSARLLAGNVGDLSLLMAEAERLRLQTNNFNSVVFVDALGQVLAASPETLGILGKQLNAPGAIEALRERRPLISQPYVAVTGNLLVFISSPVIDAAGVYRGFIGGSVYLKKKSMLNNLLGDHYYHDGSFVYVVDQNRRVLYHPDPAQVSEAVEESPMIDAVMRGETGEMRLHTREGVDMLAGYARVPSAHWGVVSQRPTQITLASLSKSMFSVLRHTLPLAMLTLLFIWCFAQLISRPLRELANSAQDMDRPATVERIQKVRSWYFESSEIKRAMLVGFNLLHYKITKLHLDAQTDPLTGLHNRRGLQKALDHMQSEQQPFAVLSLDIDHFKLVNDTWGHDAGDQVLQALAKLMQSSSREGDVLCRVGGEEFLILLPGIAPEVSEQIAERLRRQVAQMLIEPVGCITISLGVAYWGRQGGEVEEVLKTADEMLYKAKRAGRNRVEVAEMVS
ncbi:diguanylate cyclase [Pseudomonas jessenii]|uniref:sensor domain-containing diguanylate cyclase n=1 Tax=Pseudomonas jessenii TaxID=77298 RepID=UPI0038928FC9